MGIRAVVPTSLGLTEPEQERLAEVGLDLLAVDAETAVSTLADAVMLAAHHDVTASVVGRGSDPRDWRRYGAERLAQALAAARDSTSTTPAAFIFLPATAAPRSGPVAVLSPPGSLSCYEIHLGAAFAAHADRRVEHVNGRGTRGSAVHGGQRARARAAVPEWRERTDPHPERSLHRLSSRPSLIITAVPPGSADAAAVIAAHPDADIVLVFDVVLARHGSTIAQQVASMVELALEVEASMPAAALVNTPEPTRGLSEVADSAGFVDSAGTLPTILASDVIHVRLTDTAVEITNRTRQHVVLRVALGSESSTERVRAVLETLLTPEETQTRQLESVSGIAKLTAPEAVLRHWSHGSAEVFEGGERRILHVEIMVLDDRGRTHARKVYDAGNGLDFSVTARALTTLIGRVPATPALPEPARTRTLRAIPSRNLLAACESALAVGSSVLRGPKNAP